MSSWLQLLPQRNLGRIRRSNNNRRILSSSTNAIMVVFTLLQVLFLLLVVITTLLSSNHNHINNYSNDGHTKSPLTYPILATTTTTTSFVVEAQHPIIKFLQMHTTHRNQNQNNNNHHSKNMIMKRTSHNINDVEESGQHSQHEEEEEEKCSSIQLRLTEIEVQLVQSENARQELILQSERRQLEYDTREKEHNHTVTLLNEQLHNAQNMVKVQEELTQRTIQWHNTTTAELQKALQTLQEAYQALQQQKDKVTNELQLSCDQRIDEGQKECQNRIQDIQHTITAAAVTANNADNTETEQQQQQLQLKIQSLQSEKNTCDGEMQALQTQLYRTEMKYERILKEYDIELQSYIQTNFDAAVLNQTEIAVQVVQQEYDAYQINCGKSIQQLHSEIYNTSFLLNVTMDECHRNITTLVENMQQQKHIMDEDYMLQQQEWKTIFHQTQQLHNDEINELRDSLYAQCNTTIESMELLHSNTRLEYNMTIQNMTIQYQDTLQSISLRHNQTVNEYETIIYNLTNQYNTTVSDMEMKYQILMDRYELLQEQYQNEQIQHQNLQKEYQQIQISAQYWEMIFQQRSYFNITYIYLDVYDYTTQQLPIVINDQYLYPYIVQPFQQWYINITYRIVPQYIQFIHQLYQQHMMIPYIRPLYEQYRIHIVPYLTKVHEWYMTYGHVHTMKVITILSQYYHTRVLPRLLEVHHSLLQFYDNLWNELQILYDESIQHYRTIQCPKLQQSIRLTTNTNTTTTTSTSSTSMTSNRTLGHNVGLQIIQYTCDHTHETILLFLKLFGGILVVVYHRSLLRLVWYIILKFLGFIYYYNPIRLLYKCLLGRRRQLPLKPTSHHHSALVTTNGHTSSTMITTEEDLYMDTNGTTK